MAGVLLGACFAAVPLPESLCTYLYCTIAHLLLTLAWSAAPPYFRFLSFGLNSHILPM